MSTLREKLIRACESFDTANISAVLEEGANINQVNEFGESILTEILSYLYESPKIYEVVKFLLENGANPNLLDEEKNGPLTPPTLQMNEQLVELLCEYGADPNLYGGFDERETLYDWADLDYQLEIYALDFPEKPMMTKRMRTRGWHFFSVLLPNMARRSQSTYSSFANMAQKVGLNYMVISRAYDIAHANVIN